MRAPPWMGEGGVESDLLLNRLLVSPAVEGQDGQF